MHQIEAGIRLLLVDDHNVVRSGLRSLLHAVPGFRVVGEAGDGRSALRLCEELAPDVVLMDLRMPGLDGAQTTAMIKRRFPSVRIIVLTMHDGDEDVYQAIQSGAAAFVTKSAKDDELISTIRAVLEGQYRLPRWLAEQINRRNPALALTESEMRMVELIAEGKSNKEMADCLRVPEHKVKNDLKLVFSKLGCLNRTEVVGTAMTRGFLKAKP